MDWKLVFLSALLVVSITRSVPITALQKGARPNAGQTNNSAGNSQEPQPSPAQSERAEQKEDPSSKTGHPSSDSTALFQVFGPANQTNPPTVPKQSKTDQLLDKLLDPLLLVTVTIAGFTFWQIQIYRAQRDHAMVIERAYIDISHNKPGFLDVLDGVVMSKTADPQERRQTIRANVKIANRGNTPALVTRTLLHEVLTDSPLPAEPPYRLDKAKNTQVHLVKGESFNLFGRFTVDANALDAVKTTKGAMALYLLGFVEYTDKFGQQHRAGYARVYDWQTDAFAPYKIAKNDIGAPVADVDWKAHGDRNNLPYVLQPDYNYDVGIDKKGNPKKKK